MIKNITKSLIIFIILMVPPTIYSNELNVSIGTEVRKNDKIEEAFSYYYSINNSVYMGSKDKLAKKNKFREREFIGVHKNIGNFDISFEFSMGPKKNTLNKDRKIIEKIDEKGKHSKIMSTSNPISFDEDFHIIYNFKSHKIKKYIDYVYLNAEEVISKDRIYKIGVSKFLGKNLSALLYIDYSHSIRFHGIGISLNYTFNFKKKDDK